MAIESLNTPSTDELERLFVNNEKLQQIEGYLNRFNPLRTMKMERMEIRHSAVLAWLLDPVETHGLGDRFLKAFLAEALRGNSELGDPDALEVVQSDLRDAEVRCEWQNIDIFVMSPSNHWAFIIENKFDSKQHEGQLAKYAAKVNSIYDGLGEPLAIRGIFLTLQDEEPQDPSYAPIRYEAICELLPRVIDQHSSSLSPEVKTFLGHYLEILEDATGMSQERNNMENLARQLYRNHKKVLEFVMEHGAVSDFTNAAEMVFGTDPSEYEKVVVDDREYVFYRMSKELMSFLPASWYTAFGARQFSWPGCEGWWAGFPLVAWFRINKQGDTGKGKLWLYAEVGPITDWQVRKQFIDDIQGLSDSNKLKQLAFQKGATDEGKRYSKFLKQNSIEIKDVQDAEEISAAMKKLLATFELIFEAVESVIPSLLAYGRDTTR